MFLFRWPTSLWFTAGVNDAPASAQVCVSVIYQISASVGQVGSVDIELSSFAYGLSAAMLDGEDDFAFSVQVGIDLDDEAFGTLDLRASATPVFVLEQSGGIQKDVTLSAQVSASLAATLFVDAVPSVTYQVSASVDVTISVEGQVAVCVSSNYQISASTGLLLNVQLGQEDKAFAASYAASLSLVPVIAIVGGGGLVWSKKKGRYIPVRVGGAT